MGAALADNNSFDATATPFTGLTGAAENLQLVFIAALVTPRRNKISLSSPQ